MKLYSGRKESGSIVFENKPSSELFSCLPAGSYHVGQTNKKGKILSKWRCQGEIVYVEEVGSSEVGS